MKIFLPWRKKSNLLSGHIHHSCRTASGERGRHWKERHSREEEERSAKERRMTRSPRGTQRSDTRSTSPSKRGSQRTQPTRRLWGAFRGGRVNTGEHHRISAALKHRARRSPGGRCPRQAAQPSAIPQPAASERRLACLSFPQELYPVISGQGRNNGRLTSVASVLS